MNKHPIINGMVAFLYVIFVVAIMSLASEVMPEQDSYMAPVVVLSLFTLSAAVMAYLFGLQPISLYLDSKKKEAVNFFLHTVLTFGVLTVVIVILMFLGVFS